MVENSKKRYPTHSKISIIRKLNQDLFSKTAENFLCTNEQTLEHTTGGHCFSRAVGEAVVALSYSLTPAMPILHAAQDWTLAGSGLGSMLIAAFLFCFAVVRPPECLGAPSSTSPPRPDSSRVSLSTAEDLSPRWGIKDILA